MGIEAASFSLHTRFELANKLRGLDSGYNRKRVEQIGSRSARYEFKGNQNANRNHIEEAGGEGRRSGSC